MDLHGKVFGRVDVLDEQGETLQSLVVEGLADEVRPEFQQDLAQVNIKVGLTPLEFSVWRDHVRGDGIPLTAVFYAPDYFGSAQYIQYFAMSDGTPWWKRAGGANDPSITNAREADLLKQALAASEVDKDKFFHDIAMEMINDRVIIPLVSPNGTALASSMACSRLSARMRPRTGPKHSVR